MSALEAPRATSLPLGSVERGDVVQEAIRELVDATGVECADAFHRCDWAALAAALEEGGQADAWPEIRAAILEADPEADA